MNIPTPFYKQTATLTLPQCPQIKCDEPMTLNSGGD
jgi:hypothetical protein